MTELTIFEKLIMVISVLGLAGWTIKLEFFQNLIKDWKGEE